MAKKIHTEDLIRISVPEGAKSIQSIALKTDETTSVWDITQQVIRKINQVTTEWILTSPPDHYGLFFENRPNEEIDTDRFMDSYKPFPSVYSFFLFLKII